MGSVMKGLVKKGFSPATFPIYLKKEVVPKMGVWHPRGCVLHNTGKMIWPGIVKGHQITPEQRLDNMSVDWVSRGFHGGPHLVIAPDGMIWAVWPLWLPGTHSPSYNSTYWGIEMVGDFNIDPFPDIMRQSAVTAMAWLYRMIGRPATDDNFHFHKEDPRTTHKSCPGKNVGLKSQWIKDIDDAMAAIDSGDHTPAIA